MNVCLLFFDILQYAKSYLQLSFKKFRLFCLFSESQFRQLAGVSLEPIMSQQYFDDLCEPSLANASLESSVSTDSTLTSCLRQQAVICFDKISKSFFSILIDADEFKKMFPDKSLTVQNRYCNLIVIAFFIFL